MSARGHRIHSSHKLGLFLVFFLLFGFRSQGQDPEFSQFYAAPTYLNPAFVGSKQGRVTVNFRDQWPSLPQAYVTLNLAYDQYFKKLGGGIGLQVLSDRAGNGIYHSNRIAAVYSYKLRLGSNFAIHAGMEAAFAQKTLQWDEIQFNDQIDPIYGFYDAGNNENPTLENAPPSENFSYPDFSAGILGYGKKVFFGFSVKHLTEPIESFYNRASSTLPRRYVGHFGWVINYGSQRDLSTNVTPNLLFSSQGQFTQLNAGAHVNRGPLFGGFWYRHTLNNSDALIALLGVRWGLAKFGYSFDFNSSELIAHSGGSHELSIVVEFSPREKRKNKGLLECPSGF